MDAHRFDTVTKVLAHDTTRRRVLRGLVAGIGGMGLLGEEAGADKKRETKRKWCHRGDDFTILGKTKKLTKDQIKQHKKKHAADYKGTCSAARIVAPAGGGGGGGTPSTCLSNRAGTCTPDHVDICEGGDSVAAKCNSTDGCVCYTTTNGCRFCGEYNDAFCPPGGGECEADADCGEGNACIKVLTARCGGCPDTTFCALPCAV